MDARTINAGLSVSPQIAPADLQAIEDGRVFARSSATAPTAKAMDQPTFEEIEEAAQAAASRRPICRSSPARCGDEDAGGVRSR
jgi:sulfide:quinone oxidoreductase